MYSPKKLIDDLRGAPLSAKEETKDHFSIEIPCRNCPDLNSANCNCAVGQGMQNESLNRISLDFLDAIVASCPEVLTTVPNLQNDSIEGIMKALIKCDKQK